MDDIITNETVLDKHNKTHQEFVERMDSALYEIWEYSKAGSTAAYDFMRGKLRNRLVQFELDFYLTDIPECNKRATCGEYRAIMAEVMPILNSLREGALTA